MTTPEIDTIDIECNWLTQVESGSEDVVAIRSLANRITLGDTTKKEAFILGFVAHQLISSEQLNLHANHYNSNQLTLFEMVTNN